MKNLLHCKQGTNGYKKQRWYHRSEKFQGGLKRSTWYTIIMLCAFFAIPVFFSYQSRQMDKVLAATDVNVETMPVYHEPTLNPNVSERDNNIALIKKIWGKDASVGLAISRCESGYRTEAVHHNTNKTVDISLFQINSIHNMPNMDNATANTLYAYLLYKQQGTTPWNSSRSCWSK